MADDSTPLQATIDAFGDARNDAMDGVWAQSVSWTLLMRGVEAGLVREGLEEALEVVRQSQDSPEELFGKPREHARELYDRWATEGRLRLGDLTVLRWRDVPSSGLAWGSFFCLAFAVVLWGQGDSPRMWTLGMVLIPIAIGMAPVGASAAWDWFLRRRGTGSALAWAVATMVVTAATAATVNEWSKAHPLGVHSVWWYVPVAVGCALLSTAWRRWVDTWPTPAPPAAVEADAWSRQVAALLRSRYSLSDARVGTIVAEAHAYAAESGHGLHDEFGSPEEYAARFEPDHARRSRLTLAFYVAVVALNLLGALVLTSWQSLVIAAGFAWLAWREHQKGLRLRGDSA